MPIVNALSIDFEDWYQGLEIPLERWSGFEDRILDSGRRLLELFAEHDVRGTFFVLGHVAESHPDLVREIAAAGHEVATHGHSHTLVYRQSRDEFRRELARSIACLEELGEQEITGFRAPFFSITRESLWALDVMLELGLRYDSSIFPVANPRYGISDSPRWPYVIAGERDAVLHEVPLTTLRVAGRNVPVAGGAYFRIFPYAITRHAFRAVNREGKPVVFYLHPWEMDPGHPRIDLPRRIAATHYVNLGGTERRLRRLLKDFSFAPIGEVLDVNGA